MALKENPMRRGRRRVVYDVPKRTRRDHVDPENKSGAHERVSSIGSDRSVSPSIASHSDHDANGYVEQNRWQEELSAIDDEVIADHPVILSLDGAQPTKRKQQQQSAANSITPVANVRIACVVKPVPRLAHIRTAYRHAQKQLKQEAHRGKDDYIDEFPTSTSERSFGANTSASRMSEPTSAAHSRAQSPSKQRTKRTASPSPSQSQSCYSSTSAQLPASSAKTSALIYSSAAPLVMWSVEKMLDISTSGDAGDRSLGAADRGGNSSSGSGGSILQDRSCIVVRDVRTSAPLVRISGAKHGVPITAMLHAPYRSPLSRSTGHTYQVRSVKEAVAIPDADLLETDFVWVGFRDGSIRLLAAHHEKLRDTSVGGGKSRVSGGDALVVFELPKFHASSIVSIVTSPCHQDLSGSNSTASARLSDVFTEFTSAMAVTGSGSDNVGIHSATARQRGDKREHMSLLCCASMDSCITIWDVRAVCMRVDEKCAEVTEALNSYEFGSSVHLRDITTYQYLTEPQVAVKSTCCLVNARPILRLKGSVGGLRVMQWLTTMVTTVGYRKHRDAVLMTRNPADEGTPAPLSHRRKVQRKTRQQIREEHRVMLGLDETEMQEVEEELKSRLPRLKSEPRQSLRVNFIVAGDEHGTIHLWDLDEELARERGPLPESCTPAHSVTPVRTSPAQSRQPSMQRSPAQSATQSPTRSSGKRVSKKSNATDLQSMFPGTAPGVKVFRKGGGAGRMPSSASLSRASQPSISIERQRTMSQESRGYGTQTYGRIGGGVAAKNVAGTKTTRPTHRKADIKSKLKSTKAAHRVAREDDDSARRTNNKTNDNNEPQSKVVQSVSSRTSVVGKKTDGLPSTLRPKETLGAVSKKKIVKVKNSGGSGAAQGGSDKKGALAAYTWPEEGDAGDSHSGQIPARRGPEATTSEWLQQVDQSAHRRGMDEDVEPSSRVSPSKERATAAARSGGKTDHATVSPSRSQQQDTPQSKPKSAAAVRREELQKHRAANEFYARTTTRKITFSGDVCINGMAIDLPAEIIVSLRRIPDSVERLTSLLEQPTTKEIALRTLENEFDQLTEETALLHAFKNLQFFLGVEGAVIHLKCLPSMTFRDADVKAERLRIILKPEETDEPMPAMAIAGVPVPWNTVHLGAGMTALEPVDMPVLRQRSSQQREGGCFQYDTFSVYFYRNTLESHTQPVTALLMDSKRKQLWIARNDGLLSVFSTQSFRIISRVAHPAAPEAMGPPSPKQWLREQQACANAEGLPLHLVVHPECAGYPPDRFHTFLPLAPVVGYRLVCVTTPVLDVHVPFSRSISGTSTALSSRAGSYPTQSQWLTVISLDGCEEAALQRCGDVEQRVGQWETSMRKCFTNLATVRRVAKRTGARMRKATNKLMRFGATYAYGMRVRAIRTTTHALLRRFLFHTTRHRVHGIFIYNPLSIKAPPRSKKRKAQFAIPADFHRSRRQLSVTESLKAAQARSTAAAASCMASTRVDALRRRYFELWRTHLTTVVRSQQRMTTWVTTNSAKQRIPVATAIDVGTLLSIGPHRTLRKTYWKKWLAYRRECVRRRRHATPAVASNQPEDKKGNLRHRVSSIRDSPPPPADEKKGNARYRQELLSIFGKLITHKAALFSLVPVITEASEREKQSEMASDLADEHNHGSRAMRKKSRSTRASTSVSAASNSPSQSRHRQSGRLSQATNSTEGSHGPHKSKSKSEVVNVQDTAPLDVLGVEYEYYELVQTVFKEAEGRSRAAAAATVVKLALLPLLERVITMMEDLFPYLKEQEASEGGKSLSLSGSMKAILQGCVLCVDAICARIGEDALLFPEDVGEGRVLTVPTYSASGILPSAQSGNISLDRAGSIQSPIFGDAVVGSNENSRKSSREASMSYSWTSAAEPLSEEHDFLRAVSRTSSCSRQSGSEQHKRKKRKHKGGTSVGDDGNAEQAKSYVDPMLDRITEDNDCRPLIDFIMAHEATLDDLLRRCGQA